jgi:hypothetical protein
VNCKITHGHIRNVSKVRFMCESPGRANFKSLVKIVKFLMRSKIIFSLQFSPYLFFLSLPRAQCYKTFYGRNLRIFVIS